MSLLVLHHDTYFPVDAVLRLYPAILAAAHRFQTS